MPASSASFLGINAEFWIAGATLLGPILAVLLGLWVYRIQQQSQYAAERFLRDGVQNLIGTLSKLLSMHLVNYQVGTYIIRTIKTYERGHPLTPDPDQLPKFLGLQLEALPIDSLLPVQEIVGDKVVLDWVMLALSDVTLEAREADFQVRQPTVAYYRSASSTALDTDQAVRRLSAVLDAWEARVSTHFALLDRLNDLAANIAKKRPWTIGGYYKLPKRRGVAEIREAFHKGYERARQAHEETNETLRTGGLDASTTGPTL